MWMSFAGLLSNIPDAAKDELQRIGHCYVMLQCI